MGFPHINIRGSDITGTWETNTSVSKALRLFVGTEIRL